MAAVLQLELGNSENHTGCFNKHDVLLTKHLLSVVQDGTICCQRGLHAYLG